jgi:hypothetical protein
MADASKEDLAAAKIQALQRGRTARHAVDAKRTRETAAAVRIQALQRGREGRNAAARKKEGMTLFRKPLVHDCSTHAIVPISLTALRSRAFSWEEFTKALSDIVDGRPFVEEELSYSTTVQPRAFGNSLVPRVLEHLKAFQKAEALALRLREEHEAIMAARPPPPPLEVVKDPETGEETTVEPTKTKKQIREEAEQAKGDRDRMKALLEAEHTVAHLTQRLVNVFKMHAIKVMYTDGAQ